MNDDTEIPGPLLTFAEVQRLPWLPKSRKGISHPTWWRWCHIGVRGVRLETICVGYTRCTTVAWLRRFFAEVAKVRSGGPQQESPSPLETTQPPPGQSGGARRKT